MHLICSRRRYSTTERSGEPSYQSSTSCSRSSMCIHHQSRRNPQIASPVSSSCTATSPPLGSTPSTYYPTIINNALYIRLQVLHVWDLLLHLQQIRIQVIMDVVDAAVQIQLREHIKPQCLHLANVATKVHNSLQRCTVQVTRYDLEYIFKVFL